MRDRWLLGLVWRRVHGCLERVISKQRLIYSEVGELMGVLHQPTSAYINQSSILFDLDGFGTIKKLITHRSVLRWYLIRANQARQH